MMRFDPRIKEMGKGVARKVSGALESCVERGGEAIRENKPAVKQTVVKVTNSGKEFITSAGKSAKDGAKGVAARVTYSRDRMNELEKDIRNQGAYYRELKRSNQKKDSLMLGGETMALLLVMVRMPDHIQSAYEGAYPQLAGETDLRDKLSELDGDELTGFLSGIKGKLFEQKYLDYLNDGNLPDGYTAKIAESVNQEGWDLRIEGPNSEMVELLQAKATDSVGYVAAAIKENPTIDVVTTEEVYSHLVMSGVSEGIRNSNISNASLEDALDQAVNATDIPMSFAPPLFTLGLIAFTTYKDQSLTLFQKARSAGDRSGKAYLSYLVGSSLGAITNT